MSTCTQTQTWYELLIRRIKETSTNQTRENIQRERVMDANPETHQCNPHARGGHESRHMAPRRRMEPGSSESEHLQ